MPQQVVSVNPATVELSVSPFPAEWVLEGSPQARATAIAHSRDGAMTVIAWSCTKGRFRWQYQVDEMAHILSGEVFITDQSGTERRLGPGDTVFHVAVPALVGLSLRIWNKLCRTMSTLLGLDAEPRASGGGLVAEERPSGVRRASVAIAPPG